MTRSGVLTKGCLSIAGFSLLLVGAYAWIAWVRVHEPVPAVVVGVLGGTFAALLLSSFAGLFTGGRDRAALRRAANADAPQDGRIEAASGPIRAMEQPLEAPFSGQPCVAYEYDVKRADRGESDFAGVAMTACAVDTVRGRARVLGWAMLDQVTATAEDRLDRARGARYLSSAAFEPLGITSILSTLNELVGDDDGAIRKDFRIGADAIDLEGRTIRERALAVGAIVTVLGRWSESRQGFLPGGAASMNRLFAGDLASTQRQLGGNAVKTFAVALVFFVFLHAILVPMYLLAGRGAGPASHGIESVWDERDCDKQKAMLAAGADANEQGRDALTPLMNAAREGQPACVGNLIAAGARLEATDKSGDTALSQAITAGREPNVKILLASGARDFRVTAATGRRVAEGDAPLAAVTAYVDAVHRGDFAAMASVMAHSSERRMEDQRADLPLWQSLRPKRFTLEDGWMTDTAATLTIRGLTPSGEPRVVCYHLETTSDAPRESVLAEADPYRGTATGAKRTRWQITKEWFPDVR